MVTRFEDIKRKAERPLWVVGMFSAVLFIFRAGSLYQEVKTDLDLIRKTSANTTALIQSQADMLDRLDMLEVAAKNQAIINKRVMKKLNSEVPSAD